ncbi:helix-turn-helix domain-containing protein [Homoserinimonas sp. OAct 916]|uniref:AraC-like ligand-binding domain-containing protein n=1 Tax=Homoserinimonas sp. OAct 916 TaxID=2211450 RepID=UPI000DBE706E|nr:helix-turn-helix domain-containing protein [Homoserinimonas sp. OAct 916]
MSRATADQSPGSARVETLVARDFSDFQVAVSESFLPLKVSSDQPEHFRGSIRSGIVDEVHISDVRASTHVVERTPGLIAADDRAYYKLNLQLSGKGLLIQDGREALLQPGDLAVYDTSRPYSLVFEDTFRTMVVMFPRERIDLPVPLVGQLTAVHMSAADPLAGMVTPFLEQMVNNLDQLSRNVGPRLAHGALDLVTTLFAGQLDLKRTIDPNHALMEGIRAYIDENLPTIQLNPTQIATAHHISTRHLHALFSAEETSVSAWIRTRRLEHCRRDLLDPVLSGHSIAQIASRWGLVDAAHFSRVFKAAFHESPSTLRERSRAA